MIASTYRAPAWLPSAHLQTIYPLLIKPALPAYHRERWTTPDADFIDLDWIPGPPERPLIALFHGLEGSSASHYARALMHSISALGVAGVVVHFRGCSGEPNLLPRSYHSGDDDEIDWILRRLRARHTGPLFVVGVSLGGNALLKWAGTRGTQAIGVTSALAAISAPVDITAAGFAIGAPHNRLYSHNFLRTMKAVAREKHRRFPGSVDLARALGARSLYQFDDVFTAPLHGFNGVRDYWQRASSKPWLGDIRVPTLILNARNDTFLPADALPTPNDVSRDVLLEQPETGGHVGFATGPFPGNIRWLPERILQFFNSVQPF